MHITHKNAPHSCKCTTPMQLHNTGANACTTPSSPSKLEIISDNKKRGNKPNCVLALLLIHIDYGPYIICFRFAAKTRRRVQSPWLMSGRKRGPGASHQGAGGGRQEAEEGRQEAGEGRQGAEGGRLGVGGEAGGAPPLPLSLGTVGRRKRGETE